MDCRPTALRRRADRQQLTRDPTGGTREPILLSYEPAMAGPRGDPDALLCARLGEPTTGDVILALRPRGADRTRQRPSIAPRAPLRSRFRRRHPRDARATGRILGRGKWPGHAGVPTRAPPPAAGISGTDRGRRGRSAPAFRGVRQPSRPAPGQPFRPATRDRSDAAALSRRRRDAADRREARPPRRPRPVGRWWVPQRLPARS